MLSPLRRPSPLSSLSQCRTYTTESISPSRSSYRRHDREHIPPHADSRRPYLASQRNQYLFVRLKDGSVVSSMPELLGAVRGLERELGRVKDFQLQRDPYDPTRFLRWFRIRDW
ncbi:hypothetical protein BC629DRAFT_459334 [Irpex lacteus]|nr:hypothetical protein BC629DRAFT_459334 [Irpex lacteus]